MQELAVKKHISKSTLSSQRNKQKAHLKKAVIEAYSHGIIPGWVVEMVFEVAGLREI